MNPIALGLHRILVGRRPLLRWFLALLIAAAAVLFLWIGRDSDPGAARLSPQAPDVIDDVIPPAEHDGVGAMPSKAADEAGGDIIPPDEP